MLYFFRHWWYNANAEKCSENMPFTYFPIEQKTVRQPQAGRFSVFAGVPGRFCAAGSFQRICGSIRA